MFGIQEDRSQLVDMRNSDTLDLSGRGILIGIGRGADDPVKAESSSLIYPSVCPGNAAYLTCQTNLAENEGTRANGPVDERGE
jgi:hypothetical protein